MREDGNIQSTLRGDRPRIEPRRRRGRPLYFFGFVVVRVFFGGKEWSTWGGGGKEDT